MAIRIGFAFIIIFFLISISCSDSNDLNYSQETYFMPDIDVFVICSTEGSPPTRGSEYFRIPLSYSSMDDYILSLFDGQNSNSVNHFLSSMGVAFNHSHIRIVYIQAPPLVYNTTGDPQSLYDLNARTSFILTDSSTGLLNKGSFNKENGPLKLYLANDTISSSNFVGIGYVGAKGCLVLSKGGVDPINLSQIIAHELGHNFRLPHPFINATTPNPASCSPAIQNSTNHIMDYGPNKTIFAPCERIVAATFAVDNHFPKKAWIPDDNLYNVTFYRGDWTGTITVNPSLLSMEPTTASYESDTIDIIQ